MFAKKYDLANVGVVATACNHTWHDTTIVRIERREIRLKEKLRRI
jgi:hypothetical protein